jgi:trans-aconitate methyltransferase
VKTDDRKSFFDNQLSYNKKELNDSYPPHWAHLMMDMDFIRRKSKERIMTFRDLGCGTGAVCELMKRNFPDIKYIGYDISKYAISIAKEQWPSGKFRVMDCNDMNNFLVPRKGEVLHMSALLDVLENGDEVLERVCSLGFDYVLIHRVKFTNDESVLVENEEEMTDNQYYHNYANFGEVVKENGYTATSQRWGNGVNCFDIRLIKK